MHILIAAGEEFKSIDRKTEGKLLSRYPDVKWRGVMGIRDVLAHGFFQVYPGQLYDICQNDIPELIATVKLMIADIEYQSNTYSAGSFIKPLYNLPERKFIRHFSSFPAGVSGRTAVSRCYEKKPGENGAN